MGKFLEALYEDLSLYVRQTAWLNTAPQRAKTDKSEAPPLTRLEKLRRDQKDDDYEPDMPAVDAQYLLDYFYEVGPTLPDGAITYEEIQSWAEVSGIDLEPWEGQFLRRLSRQYLAECHRAEKRDCPAPVRMESASAVDLGVVARNLQQSLRELAKR